MVPSNYDPVLRTYTGPWDGSMKSAWTNNPAWITYGIRTEDRFGLGKRIKPFMVDKWELYRIAKYCDQSVPNGLGGQPRAISTLRLINLRALEIPLVDLHGFLLLRRIPLSRLSSVSSHHAEGLSWRFETTFLLYMGISVALAKKVAQHSRPIGAEVLARCLLGRILADLSLRGLWRGG
ncbi:hypothetical protein EDF87_101536 [Pseudomonas helmanticensis]|uniref:Uncharacterized protein n=1 Tax=Pseudomonas helmanticensis TaxID=1471381 RepID=A0A4R7VV22_9PSED|nr:hypothetical protein EDF87_101536 [Pseudomonas helmanticensis]